MITHIRIRNFKGLEDIEFKLGASPVVLVGPNNCGKTSILQALTMWHVGASEWIEHHSPKKNGNALRGVNIPADYFLALPPSNLKRLWHKEKTFARRAEDAKSDPVEIQIDVSGKTGGIDWNIGTAFSRPRREGIICRPMSDGKESAADVAARWRMFLPQVEFVPPMSGMSWDEDKFTTGSVLSRLGEGRTAEILRNILYLALNPEGAFCQTRGPEGLVMVTPEQAERRWNQIKARIQDKFLVELTPPRMGQKGRVVAGYHEDGRDYDLSSGGRGFHQTLLLLALLHLRPGGVFLLDEPDAHLEGVRQRDNFSMYSEIAEKHGSQLIVASHSEVVMRQAGPAGIVGIIGKKAISLDDNNVREYKKLLRDIGWDKVVAAKAAGHIVFLEGSTDIDILAAFAEKMFGARGREAAEKIRLANVEEVANDTRKAWNMFSGLRSGIPKLRGYALFDGDVDEEDKKKKSAAKTVGEFKEGKMAMQFWQRQEVENYILLPEPLYRLADAEDAALRRAESEDPETPGLPLPPVSEKTNAALMREAVEDIIPRLALRDPNDPYWRDQKMSDTIVRIMERFSKLRGGAGAWSKRKCYTLVQHMQPDEIPDEVRDKVIRLLKVIDPDFNPEESQ